MSQNDKLLSRRALLTGPEPADLPYLTNQECGTTLHSILYQSEEFYHANYPLIVNSPTGWVRDLTEEGIEPNPGPRKGKGVKHTAKPHATKAHKNPPHDKKPHPAKQGKEPGRPFKGLAKTAGGLLGSYFGPVGSSLGAAAGDWFGKFTGMGEYHLNQNSLMSDSSGIPSFGEVGNGHIICHREYLGEVQSSVDFSSTSYDLNPGLNGTFPWLAKVATNYQQYEALGLVFEFRSTSATAVSSTNTAMGTVIMATQYDSLSPHFVNKREMEASEFCTSSSPAQSFYHPVECAPRLSSLETQYIRSGGALPVGADRRFYDLGDFQIATEGMQATSTIGELWVTYKFRLLKPKLPPLGEANAVAVLQQDLTDDCTSAAPLGASGYTLKAGSDTSICGPLNPEGVTNYITLPQVGSYLVFGSWRDVVGTLTTDVALTPGSAVSFTDFFCKGMLAQAYMFNADGASFFGCFTVTVEDNSSNRDAVNNRLTVSGMAGMTHGCVTLTVVALPPNTTEFVAERTILEKISELLELRIERNRGVTEEKDYQLIDILKHL